MMLNRDDEMMALAEKKAGEGDGHFAIAYALLSLAKAHNHLRRDLCFGETVGEYAYPGVLEKIGICLTDLSNAVSELRSE